MWLFSVIDDVSTTQGWVAIIVQGGAIAILGYHLLKGLPTMIDNMMTKQAQMIEKISSEHSSTVRELMTSFRATLAEDRKISLERDQLGRQEANVRNESIVKELHTMAEGIPKDIAKKVDLIQVDLATQTGALTVHTGMMEKQTKAVERQAEAVDQLKERMSMFGSDPSKLCRAAEALEKIGFDKRTIERWVRMRGKVERKKNGGRE